MSILNAQVAAGRAIVAVDTETRTPDGTIAGHVNKLFPLHAINAIIAHRGEFGFFLRVLLGLQLPPAIAMDFDALAAGMAANLDDEYARYRAQDAAQGFTAAALAMRDYQCFALVGWSPRRREMAGFNYLKTPAAGRFATEEFRHMLSPAHASLAADVDLEDRRALQRHAKAQCSLIRREAPLGAAGGHLVIAELTPGLVLIERAGAL